MRHRFISIALAFLVLLPGAAFAQVMNLNQIASSTQAVPYWGLLMGDGVGSHKATASSSPTVNTITATSTTASSTLPKLSSTIFGAGTICLTGDSCKTTWPTGTVTSVGLSDANSTLTIGGTPVTGSGTLTATLNLANPNSWTGLQQFTNASSTLFSNTRTAYFGGTATTTIDSGGNVVIPSTASLTMTGRLNGCATFSSATIASTGSSCGTVTGVTGTYPVQSTAGTAPIISLAFGTTTSNTWAKDQTFTNGLILTATSTPFYQEGRLVYDNGNKSMTFYNADSNVSLQLGQEEWTLVMNSTGSTIANGAAVYINGASGTLPTVALADGSDSTKIIGLGLATESIANGTAGFVTTIGVVHGMDTSAFSAGATVFVSATTPGGLTATAPVSPNYRYRVGIVVVSSATVGSVEVTPSTAAIGNGTAGQFLGINGSARQAFLGFSYPLLSTGTGVSFAFGTTTSNTWAGTQTFTNPPILTGLSGLLQGNGSSAVSAVTGTAGQFPYYNGANTLLATSTLFVSTASNVGIGTTTPNDALTVYGGLTFTNPLTFDATKTGRLYKGSITGLTLQGTTGSQFDFGIYTPGGGGLLENPTGTTNVVLARAGGNVGIGTSTPVSVLGIVSGSNDGVSIDQTNTANKKWLRFTYSGNSGEYGSFQMISAGVQFNLNTAVGVNNFVIPNGNVGIGTTTPVSKLTVNGDIGTDGLPPVVSLCGTGAVLTVGSTDTAGEVTEGTLATGCTITFKAAKSFAPFCTASSEAGLAFSFTQSTTAITVTNIGALSSSKVDYVCVQNNR